VGSGSALRVSAGQNPQKFSTLIKNFFVHPPWPLKEKERKSLRILARAESLEPRG